MTKKIGTTCSFEGVSACPRPYSGKHAHGSQGLSCGRDSAAPNPGTNAKSIVSKGRICGRSPFSAHVGFQHLPKRADFPSLAEGSMGGSREAPRTFPGSASEKGEEGGVLPKLYTQTPDQQPLRPVCYREIVSTVARTNTFSQDELVTATPNR